MIRGVKKGNMRSKVSVRLLPLDISIEAEVGETVLEAALRCEIAIQHECGGNCACTTCQVHILCGLADLSDIEEVETDRLIDAEYRSEYSRLACQAILIGGPVTVRIVEPLDVS